MNWPKSFKGNSYDEHLTSITFSTYNYYAWFREHIVGITSANTSIFYYDDTTPVLTWKVIIIVIIHVFLRYCVVDIKSLLLLKGNPYPNEKEWRINPHPGGWFNMKIPSCWNSDKTAVQILCLSRRPLYWNGALDLHSFEKYSGEPSTKERYNISHDLWKWFALSSGHRTICPTSFGITTLATG